MDQIADPAVLNGGGTLKPAPTEDMVPLRRATGKAAPSLRLELRAATQDVHGRLHHHAGFAAVQDATISLAHYEALIVRLYGFYVPFEAAMAIEPERSTCLAGDLAALSAAPCLADVPAYPTPGQRVSQAGRCMLPKGRPWADVNWSAASTGCSA
jgi:hypothetical protein